MIMQEINSNSPDNRAADSDVPDAGNIVSIARRCTEVVIHINNLLGDPERAYVEAQLRALAGITATRFCDGHPHLLVVTYDTRHLASIEILDQLRAQGLTAQLIGPI
jgi:hypothetical protein